MIKTNFLILWTIICFYMCFILWKYKFGVKEPIFVDFLAILLSAGRPIFIIFSLIFFWNLGSGVKICPRIQISEKKCKSGFLQSTNLYKNGFSNLIFRFSSWKIWEINVFQPFFFTNFYHFAVLSYRYQKPTFKTFISLDWNCFPPQPRTNQIYFTKNFA